jgi:hypothetical protein
LNVIESTFRLILSRPLTRPDLWTFTALSWTGAPRGIKTAPSLLFTGSARLPLNLEPGRAELTLIGSIVLTRIAAPAGIVPWVCALPMVQIRALNNIATLSIIFFSIIFFIFPYELRLGIENGGSILFTSVGILELEGYRTLRFAGEMLAKNEPFRR